MEWEDREESSNVEDRRGIGPKGLAVGGGGIGIVIVIVALLLGVDPRKFLGPGGVAPVAQQNGQPDPQEEKLAHFTKVIFGDTERVWDEQFRKMGKQYRKPTLYLYTAEVQSGCGFTESSVGPFYCPADEKVYIDLSFYRDMERQLNAPGDFARAYVVAHEVGHHVQNLLGYSARAEKGRRSGNDLEAHHASVRLELQADYLAGVWAHYGQEKYHFLQRGDIESALNAANQIGDDRLQRKARGTVNPDTFTHGKSEQRMRWFKAGFDSGDIAGAAKLFDLPYERL
jgi:predicted metalloprotease